MKQPVLLCYNLEESKAAKLRLLAMRHKIRMRVVTPEQYGQPLLALCEDRMEQGTQAVPFDEEMLVMAFFPSGLLDTFLHAFRRMGIAPVALKAMLTPVNGAWNSAKLHEELVSEHAAMTSGTAPQDGNR